MLDVASPLGPRLEAITGFVAIAVLLLVMNWFVHKVYWTGWIAKHHRQRRKLLGRAGFSATTQLSRDDFDITWNQSVIAGIFAIGRTLRIEIDIEAVRAA